MWVIRDQNGLSQPIFDCLIEIWQLEIMSTIRMSTNNFFSETQLKVNWSAVENKSVETHHLHQ